MMNKVLNRDDAGSERLFGPFIFFGTLIACSAIIIGSMSNMFWWADAGDFDYDSSSVQLGNQSYAMTDAVYGTGGFYNVTWADVQSLWVKDSAENQYFYNDVTDDDLQLAMLRDTEYTGFWDVVLIFERWGWWTTEVSYVSYQTIGENQAAGTNYSVSEFDSHGNIYQLIVITEGNASTFSENLTANEFAIGISYDPFDPDNMAKTSLFGILGQMLTARLPNVHQAIQYLLLIPLWTGISFMIFTLISRMIPFVSGG